MLIKEFSVSNTVDTFKISRLVSGFLETLEFIHMNKIPNSDFLISDLQNLCRSLIVGQRNDLEGIEQGSWCVAPKGEMPGDARVDFIFQPSYVAVSILTRFLLDYPELAKEIPNYKDALHKGLHFLTLRKLQGHGYDSTNQMIEAIRILSLGKVPEYLVSNPMACPDLLQIVLQIKKDISERMHKGNTSGVWGGMTP
ncbi:hypothetical protein ACFL2E_03095 [Thermodesulfobacteriota bacterium]